MSNEAGGVTLLTKAALEGHEQVLSFLNLESDLEDQDALSETSFDLESFADEELYDDLVFSSSTPPEEFEKEDELEDESYDEEMALEALQEQFFDPTAAPLFPLDEFETPYMSEDEEAASFEDEDLFTIKKLTRQLLNKSEVEALKIALTKSQDHQGSGLPPPSPVPAAERSSHFITLEQVASSASASPRYAADQGEGAFLPEYPHEEVHFPIYPQAPPSLLDLTTLQALPAAEAQPATRVEVEIPSAQAATEDEEPSSSSSLPSPLSPSSGESELSEAEQSTQESEVDVEEVDVPLPLNLVLSLSQAKKRTFQFIEEQDDDSDSEGEAPLAPTPTPAFLRDTRRRKLDLPRTPLSSFSSPASSRPSSASSSRAASPSPPPISRGGAAAARPSFTVSSRKPSPLESTLHFRIQHLFPATRLPELVRLFEAEPRTRVTSSSSSAEFDLSALPAAKLEKMADFVNQCIKQRAAEGLRQEEQASRPILKAKRHQQQEQQHPSSSPKANDPPQARRGRARKDTPPAPSKKASPSPLHTATSKPLPSAHFSKTTATAIAQKVVMVVEDSDDEIDVVGI